MKYRESGKIKKQHGIIKGLHTVLRRMVAWEEVQGIIPGRIEKARQKGDIQLRVSYATTSGLKVIARGNGSVQEVFFVSCTPQTLWDRLMQEGYV